MFCDNKTINKDCELTCGQKGLSQIIAFISLICSLFVIIVTKINLKPNLYNQLIIQIIISEILDEINTLLAIIIDYYKPSTFENYNNRMYICYPQIFLGTFTCLWTLTSSFFISLKLYDTVIYRKKIFKNYFLRHYTNILTIIFPGIISFIFWAVQVSYQSYNLQLKTHFYEIKNNDVRRVDQHFRHMYCFLDKILTHVLCVIVFIFIIGNSYLSLKSGKTVLNAKNEFKKINDVTRGSIKENLKKMQEIHNTLFLYPIIADIVWVSFFILNYYFLYHSSNGEGFGISSWIYCILIFLRQISYTLLYFFTNSRLRENSIRIFKCEICKNKNQNLKISKIDKSDDSTGPIIKEEGGDNANKLI